MKIAEMTRKELERFVKRHCVKCKKTYRPFLAEEWYEVVDQDETGATIECDNRAHPFTYEEMDEYFLTLNELEQKEEPTPVSASPCVKEDLMFGNMGLGSGWETVYER